MTNPNNMVRVRARANGRASVYEANAWAQSLSTGILDGDLVSQNSPLGMNVLVGGSAAHPDVVIAQNPSGYKIALDIVERRVVTITKPASNSRRSAIVAYTDDLTLSSEDQDVTGSPSSCGLIVVNGPTSATPVNPTDEQIRTAITADGASGTQASYAVLAYVLVSSSATTITDERIFNQESGVIPEKIDYRHHGDNNYFPILNNLTQNNNINSYQFTNQYTYEVPHDGVYFAWFSQRMEGGGDGQDMALKVTLNTTDISYVASGGLNYTNHIAPSAIAVVSAKAGDHIYFASVGGGASARTLEGRVCIARLR